MIKLKVRKFGNFGVVLPKEVVNRLHTKDGEPLFLTEAPDGGYQILTIPLKKSKNLIYRMAIHDVDKALVNEKTAINEGLCIIHTLF